MKSFLMLLAAVCASANVFARPMVIESQEVVPTYMDHFAFAGDEVIATRSSPLDGLPPNERFHSYADLYRRGADGKWTLVTQLLSETGLGEWPPSVAMTAEIAMISMPSGLHILEKSASGWAAAPVNTTVQGGELPKIVGNTIMASGISAPGHCLDRVYTLERGTTNVWAVTSQIAIAEGSCIDNLDFDGGRAIVHVDHAATDTSGAMIFERSGSTWNLTSTVSLPDTNTNSAAGVAIRGDVAIAASPKLGAHVYRRSSAGWALSEYLPNLDSYPTAQGDAEIQITDQFVVKTSNNTNREAFVAYVYRRMPDQAFEHVANVWPVGQHFRFDGHRIVGEDWSALRVFDLPASFDVPPVVQEDFESGVAADWTPIPGSQFAIVDNGQTHVFRQSSVAGDAGAIHSDDLTNQHVSADIRPILFQGGSDQWVGLITRYTDPGNYYYVTLRHSRKIVLKRVLNGVIGELGSFPMAAALKWHRIELESSGTQHSVYVDGRRVLKAFDASHTHGRAGIRSYRASADYDNVVISPGPVADQDSTDRVATGGQWSPTFGYGAPQFSQDDANSGDARAVSGLPREDVVVQADVRIDGLAIKGTPWAGLIARYVDNRNYYYVTIRANELSLRKLTNGTITILGNEPFTRQVGIPVDLRLEAIGDRLRVYVNDALRIEYAGAEIAAGKAGVMTYRAAATFSNYLAIEP